MGSCLWKETLGRGSYRAKADILLRVWRPQCEAVGMREEKAPGLETRQDGRQRSDQGKWGFGKLTVATHTGQRGWKFESFSRGAQTQLGRDTESYTEVG